MMHPVAVEKGSARDLRLGADRWPVACTVRGLAAKLYTTKA
jgi:hypothetical protein